MHLIPQAIQLGRLSFVQHQALQMIIFTIVQRQGNHFINRHNLGVTKSSRKQVAEIVKFFQQSFSSRAVLRHQNRSVVTNGLITVGPCCLTTFDRGCTRRKTGELLGFRRQNLQLYGAFRTSLGMQGSRRDKLAAFHKVSRNHNFDDRWSLHTEILCCDRCSIRMLPEHRWIQASQY